MIEMVKDWRDNRSKDDSINFKIPSYIYRKVFSRHLKELEIVD